MTAEDFDLRAAAKVEDDEDEDEGSNSVHKDLAAANRLCTIIRRWRNDTTDSLFDWSAPLLGSDIHLVVGEVAVPAHRTILALRIPVINKVLQGGRVDRVSVSTDNGVRIHLDVCHPLVALLLLQYVYSDEIAAIWDARVMRVLQAKFADLALPFSLIKADLKALADSFGLTLLSTVLDSASKLQMAKKTLSADLQTFFTSTYSNPPSATECDVKVRLADKDVSCSSVILRARCPFFEAMFADRDWTTERIDKGTVSVDMTHLRWRPMRMVFRYLHEGLEDDLFDYLRMSFTCQDCLCTHLQIKRRSTSSSILSSKFWQPPQSYCSTDSFWSARKSLSSIATPTTPRHSLARHHFTKRLHSNIVYSTI